jgi:serine/threonine protein kinase
MNEDLSNNNIIIGKKYKIIEEIGEGSFGKLFKAVNIFSDEYVAIKIEKKLNKSILKLETNIYTKLKNIKGVPQLRYFGIEENFNYMVIDLLSESLEDLVKKNGKLDLEYVLSLAIEGITVLENIHNKCIIHRDIKPDNLMLGFKQYRNKIHLIDFGLSRYYINENGSHKEISYNKKLIGTAKYASLNVLEGIEASRRDDLLSFGYVLIYCLKGSLPWENIEGEKEIKYEKIKESKKMNINDLCKDLPYEFLSYMDYCNKIKYEETPNYSYIKTIFTNLSNLIKSN